MVQEEKEEDSSAEYANMRYLKQGHWPGSDALHYLALWLQDMYILMGFSPEAAKLLIREKELNSLERMRVLINKNVDEICNVMRKPGGKNANGMPKRGHQLLVIA